MKAFAAFILTALLPLQAIASGRAKDKEYDAFPEPVRITAMDMVTKVYGIVDPSLSREKAAETAMGVCHVKPENEETGLWLSSDSGYMLEYYGMVPEISAVANFDENGATQFGYFFLFPYRDNNREWADASQCSFCSVLLQELHDLGLVVGVPDSSDSIFEVFGCCGSNQLNVRLNEEKFGGGNGCFVVSLGVVPNAYTAADALLAEN